jgi:hypothetical protein
MRRYVNDRKPRCLWTWRSLTLGERFTGELTVGDFGRATRPHANPRPVGLRPLVLRDLAFARLSHRDQITSLQFYQGHQLSIRLMAEARRANERRRASCTSEREREGSNEGHKPYRKLVTTAGIEPATHSLGNCCSIQLSYVVTV